MTDNVQRRTYVVIEAPSILGLKPTAVNGLARTLLEHGLAKRVNARHAGV
jgi:arginase